MEAKKRIDGFRHNYPLLYNIVLIVLILLAIALGLHFTCDETQTMLRIAGLSPLYPRIRRDAVILQQLAAGKSLYECNDRLAACGEVMIG